MPHSASSTIVSLPHQSGAIQPASTSYSSNQLRSTSLSSAFIFAPFETLLRLLYAWVKHEQRNTGQQYDVALAARNPTSVVPQDPTQRMKIIIASIFLYYASVLGLFSYRVFGVHVLDLFQQYAPLSRSASTGKQDATASAAVVSRADSLGIVTAARKALQQLRQRLQIQVFEKRPFEISQISICSKIDALLSGLGMLEAIFVLHRDMLPLPVVLSRSRQTRQ